MLMMLAFCLLLSPPVMAQKAKVRTDSTRFCGRFANADFDIYLCLDAYRNSVVVPGQEIYGSLPGYLGDNKDGRKWLFTSSTLTAPDKLRLEIINDYGSEDLTATLQQTDDSTFVLRQVSGSTIKVVRDYKWVKLPGKLVFRKVGTGK